LDRAASFYAQQGQWLDAYNGDVQEQDHEQAATIEWLAGPGSKRVLELGASGGHAAAATAALGHRVTALELVPAAAQYAQQLATRVSYGSLTVIQADFYTVQLPECFDVVCYWDGFGIGADADQHRLLARIRQWLVPGGCALIDILTPWYWAATVGREMCIGEATRRYDFDADGCRMLDRWWPTGDETQAIVQSLRCYSPADLRLLMRGTGLRLQSVEAGGMMDYETMRYHKHVPLRQAMGYTVKLVIDDAV